MVRQRVYRKVGEHRRKRLLHAGTPSAALTVHVLEDVENGEDLPVVGHQRLPHQVGRRHQVLQDLQGGADHLPVPGVQGVWKVEVRETGTQRGQRGTQSSQVNEQHQQMSVNGAFKPVI